MLCKLCVQVMRATILVLLQFRFLQNISEFLPNQVLLLLIKYVDTLFDIVEPRMVKHLFRCEALRDVFLQHVLH